MLLGNYSVLNKTPGKWRAGSSTCDRSAYNSAGMTRGLYYNDSSVFNTASNVLVSTHLLTSYGIAQGTVAWIIPQTTGGMAMRSLGTGTMTQSLIPQQPTSSAMTGSGSMSATIYGLGNLLAALTGSTTFTTAITSTGNIASTIIASGGLTASITGNGNITFSATGSGILAGAASLYYNMLCALTGSGTLTADASLLISMLCSMAGSSTLTANITGQLHPTCSMTGTGSLAGNITAFGNMVANLIASGTLNAGFGAIANMSMDIVVTGTGLTTANVGSAIWGALTADFNNAGTMGEIMNNMGAVSDPWAVTLPASYTADQAGAILDRLETLAKQIKSLTAAQL